ncbi:flotillin-like FloA family protein [Pelagicoccus sp. SDUM812002]|uniref:flotillin-like FloA family protein n=1 Tax=Pelagicoccus sp. SDUM812002 TaxID=3041266 RepID=UPI00280D70EA|nr:flotillin-like FloA family protein [Pelagicoccus sp. SDUM812002]MDQ8188525.1 flotillin-like FloA family protein [Pelagicoccus sp. SDUM812002]
MSLFLKERFAMSIRGCPASKLIRLFKKSESHGLGVSLSQLEAHHLCGGDPFGVVDELIDAKRNGIELEWDRACAIDLATMNTDDSLSQAIERAKSSIHDSFDMELSSAGERSWILTITVSHKVNLHRYVGGADFPILKERIIQRIEEFYESKKEKIASMFPTQDLKSYILEKSPDVGTKLSITDIGIEIQN